MLMVCLQTYDSTSDADLCVELPRSLNLPDSTTCYVDDNVIPHIAVNY
jgi:hypothetical protein